MIVQIKWAANWWELNILMKVLSIKTKKEMMEANQDFTQINILNIYFMSVGLTVEIHLT